MKRLQISLSVILVLITLMSSCQKKDGAGGEPTPLPLPLPPSYTSQITNIGKDAYNYTSIEYTGKMVSAIKLVSHNQPTRLRVSLGATGKPVSGDLDGYQLKFHFIDSQLQKIEYFNWSDPNTPMAYDTFSYNKNRMMQTTFLLSDVNRYFPTARIVYIYDVNGDISSVTDSVSFGNSARFVMASKTEYSYDDKPNPLAGNKELLYPLHINHSLHNVKTQRFYNERNRLGEAKDFVYSYEQNGLPKNAVETAILLNSAPTTSDIEYTYSRISK